MSSSVHGRTMCLFMDVLAGLWVTRLEIGGYAGPMAYPPLRVCISAGTQEALRTRRLEQPAGTCETSGYAYTMVYPHPHDLDR